MPRGKRPGSANPYQVTESTGTAEFLWWCELPDDVWPVQESYPEECATATTGTWDHFPLTVNAEPTLVQETLDAIQNVNQQLGFEMLRFDFANYRPDVVVVAGGSHWMAAAEAKRFSIEGVPHGLITTYNGLDLADRPDIIAHEFGHILGLMHDPDNRMSIMYPGPTTKAALFEPQDIFELRRIYLRE
mgnify:CR=1 FL=1